jgi:hypothetical protein
MRQRSILATDRRGREQHLELLVELRSSRLFNRKEPLMLERHVNADPYHWPYKGDLQPDNTALIIIDMQIDFCGIDGYVDRMGYDISLTGAPIEPIGRVLGRMRANGSHIFQHPRRSSP